VPWYSRSEGHRGPWATRGDVDGEYKVSVRGGVAALGEPRVTQAAARRRRPHPAVFAQPTRTRLRRRRPYHYTRGPTGWSVEASQKGRARWSCSSPRPAAMEYASLTILATAVLPHLRGRRRGASDRSQVPASSTTRRPSGGRERDRGEVRRCPCRLFPHPLI
jgi:hypothetical protein